MRPESLPISSNDTCDDVPMPIVKLNRWTLILGVVIGIVMQQPLIITFLLCVLLPTVFWGQRWSLIVLIGKQLFKRHIPHAEREDRRLMRFNNTIAVLLLGAAQLAFLLDLPFLGWGLALMVALAAAVALAGFCVGCFLYYQLRLFRYRLLKQ